MKKRRSMRLLKGQHEEQQDGDDGQKKVLDEDIWRRILNETKTEIN